MSFYLISTSFKEKNVYICLGNLLAIANMTKVLLKIICIFVFQAEGVERKTMQCLHVFEF